MDICAHNSFLLWTLIHPEWNQQHRDRRRLYLLELGRALVLPAVLHRDREGLQRPIVRAISVVTGDFAPAANPPALADP